MVARRRELPRIDTQKIRDAHDCREVIAKLYGPPRTGGGAASHAWTWRCPFHGEQHGAALVAWEDGWACYGACGDAGDVIAFIVKYKGLRFVEAVKFLEGGEIPTLGAGYVAPERVERDYQAPPEAWSQAASRFVTWSEEKLRQNVPLMRYLLENRMLTAQTIRLAHLGASPGRYVGWTKQFGLLHQRGITIPWAVGKHWTAINVRRMLPERSEEHKYRQVQGSFKGLYGWNSIVDDGRPLVFAEGEFDTLLLNQCIGDRASVVTLGGSNDRLSPCFRQRLLDGRNWICVHDADAAGLNLLRYLRTINPTTVGFPVPVGKDVTEFVASLPGGQEARAIQVRHWFEGAV